MKRSRFPVILIEPMMIRRSILPLLAALLLSPGQGAAQSAPTGLPGAAVTVPVFDPGSSSWSRSDQADVRLISKTTGVGDAAEARLGLEFVLKPGWKIYWRSPGDAGYPPSIDWSGSSNLAGADISWPAPHRFSILGLETVGYKDAVILPIAVRLGEPGRGLTARAAVEFLICDQICVPGRAEIELVVPAGPAQPSPFSQAINRFEVQVPGDGAAHGLTLDRVAVETTPDGGAALAVSVTSVAPLDHPDLFVEGIEGLTVGAPGIVKSADGRAATLRAPIDPGGLPEGGLIGKTPRLTVVDGPRGVERTMAIVDGGRAPGDAAATTAAGLSSMLLVALLGGLILNLMPCVLPVLSLKVMGMVGHGGAERRHVRLSFLASAAGIVASFLVLAGAAIAVKSVGLAVGWGIQFQQPMFLVAMVVLLTVFAANLWGLFEIVLPDAVNLGGLLERRGGPDHSHSYGGHFLTGALATLLATPCSAPFLGTAVGFALARGAVEIALIFLALGLGMAAPYLMVAAMPGMAARLPRPGRWMLTVKKGLGLALLGTAAWLLTVLTATVGGRGAGLVGAMMAGALLLFLLRRKVGRKRRALATAAIAGLIVGAFGVPLAELGDPVVTAEQKTGGIVWEPFSLNAVAQMVLDGKVVFVDVTADWCVTCQVNKRLVIEQGEVARLLESRAVIPVKADWTKPSDEIAAYLASFGRYGIPFNAVYGPGAPNGVPLPELLSEAEVLAAIETAQGGLN